MARYWIVRLFAVFVGLHALTTTAYATKREVRLPLMGCRGHFAATGFAKSIEVWSEPSVKDRRELIIEIRNVPLRPGTVLVVYVDDDVVGRITLDAKQNGSLKITSDDQPFVPKLDWGTSVKLTKIDGSIISW